MRWWPHERTRPHLPVEAGRHAARQVGPRPPAPVELGRLEHGEIAGALGGAVHHAQQPAVALGRIGPARHEDRLAEAIVGIGASTSCSWRP